MLYHMPPLQSDKIVEAHSREDNNHVTLYIYNLIDLVTATATARIRDRSLSLRLNRT